jgi:hypothetical protein
MKEELVTLETALLAKEKGFDWNVVNFYNSNNQISTGPEYMSERDAIHNWNTGGTYPTRDDEVIASAPTQSLLQKWLRDVHNIGVTVGIDDSGALWGYTIFPIDEEKSSYQGYPFINEIIYDTYEETLEVGLLEALNLI